MPGAAQNRRLPTETPLVYTGLLGFVTSRSPVEIFHLFTTNVGLLTVVNVEGTAESVAAVPPHCNPADIIVIFSVTASGSHAREGELATAHGHRIRRSGHHVRPRPLGPMVPKRSFFYG